MFVGLFKGNDTAIPDVLFAFFQGRLRLFKIGSLNRLPAPLEAKDNRRRLPVDREDNVQPVFVSFVKMDLQPLLKFGKGDGFFRTSHTISPQTNWYGENDSDA